jgi:hypothetical protein
MDAKTDNWPAFNIERRPISDLKPYANNPRWHSESQVAEIAASIREWGWTTPILIDEAGGIIAGHGRFQAAQTLGIIEVPVIIARGWTDAQIRAYVIADNQLALNAGWDEELLRVEITALGDMGFDTGLLGFGEESLAALFAEPAEPEPPKISLSERFGIPPFSVMNAREGWWQDRKAAWLALGIQSELGRGDTAGSKLTMSEMVQDLKPSADQAAKRSRANATVNGAAMPAADYGKNRARGDGRGRAMANGKSAARTFGQDLMRGEHIVGETNNLKAAGRAGLVFNITAQAYGQNKRKTEKGSVVAGKGWAEGGPARRDAAFYAKKRAWEKANGRKISTTEFREKHWNGAA